MLFRSSGTQKCLSCPPGLAPLTMSPRALEVIKGRKTKTHSWYLDLAMIADYWAEGKRAYHHTAPISMVYALREALRLVHEEGLEPRFTRHRRNSAALMAGLKAYGCGPQAQEGHRLPTLNCVTVPPTVDEGLVRKTLLSEFGIEIGGGLGPLAGKVWRIGLMGESSRQQHVVALLSALELIFHRHRLNQVRESRVLISPQSTHHRCKRGMKCLHTKESTHTILHAIRVLR